MKENRKIWIIVLGILSATVLLYCFFIFVKPSKYIINKENFQFETSPTAKSLDYMSKTDEIFAWIKDLVDIGVQKAGTQNWQRADDYVLAKFQKVVLESVGPSVLQQRYGCAMNGVYA